MAVTFSSFAQPTGAQYVELLPDEMMVNIFLFIRTSSALQATQIVCRRWRRIVISHPECLLQLTSEKCSSLIEKALVAARNLDKGYFSFLCAQMAEVVPNSQQALDLLRRSLDTADKIGYTSEYCDEDGSKPHEYDGDRFDCYFRMLRSVAHLQVSETFLKYMLASPSAHRIAREKFNGGDITDYMNLTKLFVPQPETAEVLDFVQKHFELGYGYGKFLLIQAVKTYRNNAEMESFLLDLLNRIGAEIFKKSLWYLRPFFAVNIDFFNLERAQHLLEGYCYLAQFGKALEIIKDVEAGQGELERSANEWLSKAYLKLAAACATKGQVQEVSTYCDKISDPSMNYMKRLIMARAYREIKKPDESLEQMRLAEEEVDKIFDPKRCLALAKIAREYFYLGSFTHVYHCWGKVGLSIRKLHGNQQSKAILALLKIAKLFHY